MLPRYEPPDWACIEAIHDLYIVPITTSSLQSTVDIEAVPPELYGLTSGHPDLPPAVGGHVVEAGVAGAGHDPSGPKHLASTANTSLAGGRGVAEVVASRVTCASVQLETELRPAWG